MNTLIKILVGILLGLLLAVFLLRLGVNHGKHVDLYLDNRSTPTFAGCEYVLVASGDRALPYCVRG
jgi:hypothetical protein